MNIDKPRLLWQLPFEGAWPTGIAFVGPQRLAAGNRDGQLLAWDLPDELPEKCVEHVFSPREIEDLSGPKNPAPSLVLEGHTNNVTRLRTVGDPPRLVSSSFDRNVHIWDLSQATGSQAQVVVDGRQREKLIEKKKDLSDVAALEVPVCKPQQTLSGHSDWVGALAVSQNGQVVASGDDRGQIIVWKDGGKNKLCEFSGRSGTWIGAMALNGDGSRLFVTEYSAKAGDFDHADPAISIFDTKDGTLLLDVFAVEFPEEKDRTNRYKYGKFIASGLVAADWSPDGKLIAAAQGGETDTGKAHILDAETGKCLRTISGHRYGMTDVRFSRCGKYILSCGRDTMVRITGVEDGKEVAALGTSRGGQFKDWLYNLTISPDEKLVAATDIAGLVQVWAVN